MIVTSKTFWKVIGGIFGAIFLFVFIIANLIGIILTYLGFADADAFANEAQSEELSNLKIRIEQIFDQEEYEREILAIMKPSSRGMQVIIFPSFCWIFGITVQGINF